ncbi:hypothetical protein OGATHE_002804 [Ogataea polymorpha]|uniref:Uncharacterized protein n=1 Tax=Ogataea polymorpha TaxID=460523 RepID=A0A9P8T8L3_9ASCO|nr:hypothetical protein OGATHE_002804 [Ogataea polymorpha]
MFKELLADLVQLFGSKWSFTDSGGVSLNHTVNVLDALRRNTKSCQDTSDAGIGRCHIRIGSKINVQHQSVCTLDKDLFLFFQSLVHELDRVHHEGLDLFTQILVFGNLRFDIKVELAISFETSIHKSSQSSFELVPRIWLVTNKMVNSNTRSGHFGGISWPDSFTGGTNRFLIGGQFRLSKFVNTLVEVEHQVRSGR